MMIFASVLPVLRAAHARRRIEHSDYSKAYKYMIKQRGI